MQIDDAFKAGVESFVDAGFHFGDPRSMHPPGHLYKPEYVTQGCTPPVHGECALLRFGENGEIVTTSLDLYATDRRSRMRSARLSFSSFSNAWPSAPHAHRHSRTGMRLRIGRATTERSTGRRAGSGGSRHGVAKAVRKAAAGPGGRGCTLHGRFGGVITFRLFII